MEQHLHSGGMTRKRLPFSIEAILDENFPRKEKRTQARNFELYEQKDEVSMIMTESSTQTMGEISCEDSASNTQTPRYAWLECSRKNPPKVQRSKRKRGITMRPSRQPRIPFTSFQQTIFENQFQIDHYLTSEAVRELASHLELPEQRIKIWFQNRRARERRESQQKADNTKTTTTTKCNNNNCFG